jgi:imidazoleglycerol-phosphate dehydratase
VRFAEIERITSETHIEVVVDLDGPTKHDAATGIGIFDHLLQQLAFHGQIVLSVNVTESDLEVDEHHVVEDVGIVLGQAINMALDQEEQISRYGSNHTPMDDALVLCSLDISGRGSLHWDVPFERERIGDLATESIQEFFGAVARHAGITLHMRKVNGHNDHHLCIAIFRAFGLALTQACRRQERKSSSTKGTRG